MEVAIIIKKKLEKFSNALFKFLTSKKSLTAILAGILLYKLFTMPKLIQTSDFLSFLKNSSNELKQLIFFDGLVVFKNLGRSCMANLPSNFKVPKDLNIPYNYFTGFQGYLENPFYQLYGISAIFGAVVSGLHGKEIAKLVKDSGKKKTMPLVQENIFDEFVANDNVKKQINTIVEQLKNPQKFKDRNIKLISGCLLFGKPGTGKTLLARCLSKLQGITFIDSCASEFVEIYVGSGPKKVREIFEIARENRPAIVFIDEIESIGVQRSSDHQSYTSNVERYATLNQLLTELDGVRGNENIVVIAATNREDLLDSALVRPGRFEYKINLAEPDDNLRVKLFNLYLKKHKYDEEIINQEYIVKISRETALLTGANIESIVNGAATNCLNSDRQIIEEKDLNTALSKGLADFHIFRQHENKNSMSGHR